MELRYSLLLLFLYIWESAGQNSWAAHLRRNNKRIASIRKSLLSKGLARRLQTSLAPEKPLTSNLAPKIPVVGPRRRGTAKKSSSLIAAASGHGYFSRLEETYDDEPPTRESSRPRPQYDPQYCHGKRPGSFGNPNLYCKVFHVCQADGRFDKFDCPASLRFNNYLGVCDWPASVDEYCNPVRYNLESPQREPYNYAFGSGPYITGNEMSYAAAERYSRRTRNNVKKKKPRPPVFGITTDTGTDISTETLLPENQNAQPEQ